MLQLIESIIAREERFLLRFAPGTSHHSLLKNRIAALNTVQEMLTGDRLPDRADLVFALPRVESMLRKVRKARDKYEPGTRNYLRFDPTVQRLKEAHALILQMLEVAP